ncbi:hypothetical protein MKY88_02530 [Lysinibacillus sp. FSL R7-0073]|uniref:hypothetical protein n=1 Tax=Lysinibacillus sp. FSL R7-0073 TaxID=2921669 RepID=UPI0030F92A9A
MVWIYVNEDKTCVVFYVKEGIPQSLLKDIKEFPELPQGEGILMMDDNGELYYKPYPEGTEPPDIEPPIEQPTETKPPELSVGEIQAQILLNTEYLVSRAELGLGGI